MLAPGLTEMDVHIHQPGRYRQAAGVYHAVLSGFVIRREDPAGYAYVPYFVRTGDGVYYPPAL
jgi:hypothetical protein